MTDSNLPLSLAEFTQQWKAAGEPDSPKIVDTAWRRYQHVHAEGYQTVPEKIHPTLDQLQAFFEPLLNASSIAPLWTDCRYLDLSAKDIPWTSTGVLVSEDQPVSVFATGRTWRSKLLDLYLPPQFNLWYRIGVNGTVFNSTHDTRTFKCMKGESGELYLANQFPGGFHDKHGGRVGGNLSVYNKAEGGFQILVIQWRQGMPMDSIKDVFEKLYEESQNLAKTKGSSHADPYGLLTTGLRRLSSDYFMHKFPVGWKLLWFLGVSEIFFQEQDSEHATANELELNVTQPLHITEDGTDQELQAEMLVLGSPLEKVATTNIQPMIRCFPDRNVGILQQDLNPPIALDQRTRTKWFWNITDLPSRLREDTTISHDYLSLAFEFENGRDLTYTWSWELPVGFGYWCPLPAWCDREYHIVVRSGTDQLGRWLKEERNIHEDYMEYINAADSQKLVPSQIVRVWLIAGNRWQRHRGEMLIKQIQVFQEGAEDEATIVL